MNRVKNRERIFKMVGIAMLSAIVVILQLLGSFIKFGPFSISLVLVPIVVGAGVYGLGAGTWLGFVFAITVLLSGDAATLDTSEEFSKEEVEAAFEFEDDDAVKEDFAEEVPLFKQRNFDK